MNRILKSLTRRATLLIALVCVAIVVGVGVTYATVTFGWGTGNAWINQGNGINLGYVTSDTDPGAPTDYPTGSYPANAELRFKDQPDNSSTVVSEAFLKLGGGFKRIWAYTGWGEESINVNASTVKIQSVAPTTGDNTNRSRITVTPQDVVIQLGQ